MTENLLEASLVEAQRGAGSDPRAITSERSPTGRSSR